MPKKKERQSCQDKEGWLLFGRREGQGRMWGKTDETAPMDADHWMNGMCDSCVLTLKDLEVSGSGEREGEWRKALKNNKSLFTLLFLHYWPRLLAVNSANLFDVNLVGQIYCNLVHWGDNQICVNFHNNLQMVHISWQIRSLKCLCSALRKRETVGWWGPWF